MPNVRVEGSVSAGYESVREMFGANLARGQEDNAQLCAYVKGKKVVDLWGSSIGDGNYDGETMQNVFSSGKTVAALAMACLVDRGQLSYNDRVTKYWPEFSAHGKGDLLVKDALRHEGGFPWIDKLFKWEDFSTESIKKNVVGKAIEEDEQHYPPSAYETKREYHAISRGWLLNEIFRRAEPSGRTMGEFVRADVSNKLGINTFIGVKEEELRKVTDIRMWDYKTILWQCSLPYWLGSKSEISIVDLMGLAYKAFTTKKKPLTAEEEAAKATRKRRPKVQIEGMTMANIAVSFNDKECRKGETPSAGVSSSARGLAKIAACIVGGGEVEGVRVLGEGAVQAMQEEWKVARDYGLGGMKTSFSQGGVNKFETYPDDPARVVASKSYREGWIGWMGLGGSVLQWEPDLQIGFGFASSLLHMYDLSNLRTAKYQKEVAKCAKALRDKETA